MASCFNEQYNETVWSESISQGSDVIRYWMSHASIRSTADDLRTLSLDVLSKAGFDKSFKFKGYEETTHVNPSESYKDSLQLILHYCILIIAMGPKFFTNNKSWLPHKYRQIGDAVTAFQNFMTDMYESEKSKIAKGLSSNSGPRTFLSSIAKASLEAKEGDGLTEREIYGNIFVINFAGHDTSAHVFTFAVYFLAANPEVQDWVSEEVKHVFGYQLPHEWDYTQFPRLKRCLAVLYETIRLYTPVGVTKWTREKTQRLDIQGKTLILPPNTMINLAHSSLQTDPRWWGEDSLTWRPSRFIKTAGIEGTNEKGGIEKEEFITPRRGTFVGWSEGARDCPGRKFSQVEFVATIASLFRDHRVDPVKLEGESIEAARERVLDLIKTDTAFRLLLQMLHPEKAPLTWSRR